MSLLADFPVASRSGVSRARWFIGLFLSALLATTLPAAANESDVLLVLDNSGSMRKNDPNFLLKRAVSKFVDELTADTRVGMVIFDAGVEYPVPLGELTVDSREAIGKALEQIDYRGQLTNSPAAIERAVYELKSNARTDAGKIIIFMTDGIVDTGDAEIDKDKTKWMREELSADAADNDIRMFAIAFTENADFFLIQSLAKRTNGEYFRALTPEDLAEVFASVHEKLAAAPQVAAPPPAVVEPPPEAVAPAPAASGSCLATLVLEEREMMEEAAPDAGVTAEQLCQEMMAVVPGEAVVVTPPGVTDIAPPVMPGDQVSEQDLGLLVILGLAALLLIILVVLVVVLLRRRAGTAGVAGAVEAPPIPDAFLKDVNGITGDPATKVGIKPLVIGRVAGTDPTHMDYFVVDKGTIGRRHAIIQYRDFSFWLHDQGSVNGTYLNGEQVTAERQLKHGDRIKFHKYEFEFSVPELDSGGHTVFADPSDATMVGDATVIGSTAAFAASELEAAGSPSAPAPVAKPATPQTTAPAASDDLFDEEVDTVMLYGEVPEGDETAEGEIPVVEAVMTPVVVPALDDEEPPTDEEFDAEASAFFDDGDMGGQTNAPMGMSDFDEAPTAVPPVAAAGAAERDDDFEDFSESETMTPGDVYADHDPMSQTSDISLDEFMRTDTFEAPIPGFDRDDADDDATLMPDHVPGNEIGEATGAPSIDDVFDITGEGTVPPVADKHDEDEDDSEAPTQFRH